MPPAWATVGRGAPGQAALAPRRLPHSLVSDVRFHRRLIHAHMRRVDIMCSQGVLVVPRSIHRPLVVMVRSWTCPHLAWRTPAASLQFLLCCPLTPFITAFALGSCAVAHGPLALLSSRMCLVSCGILPTLRYNMPGSAAVCLTVFSDIVRYSAQLALGILAPGAYPSCLHVVASPTLCLGASFFALVNLGA